ncbi:MAG: hypothetical protein ABSE16_03795 [Verrucomicrobiota bacterium]|jgi:hypothetical protein
MPLVCLPCHPRQKTASSFWECFGEENYFHFSLAIAKQLGYIDFVMRINEQIRGYFAAIGRKGGKATSDSKTEAARKNAKKGGWPKGRPRKPNKQNI